MNPCGRRRDVGGRFIGESIKFLKAVEGLLPAGVNNEGFEAPNEVVESGLFPATLDALPPSFFIC